MKTRTNTKMAYTSTTIVSVRRPNAQVKSMCGRPHLRHFVHLTGIPRDFPGFPWIPCAHACDIAGATPAIRKETDERTGMTGLGPAGDA